jgi:hypothetical protein
MEPNPDRIKNSNETKVGKNMQQYLEKFCNKNIPSVMSIFFSVKAIASTVGGLVVI